MTEGLNHAYGAIDEAFAHKPAATRRQLVAGAAGVLGSMGLLNLVSDDAFATHGKNHVGENTVANIINIAATAEVLATIVNTVGFESVPLDDVTKRNIRAAAREELIHYEVLVSDGVGAKPATKRIWVPDEVFASRENFLTTLVVGDQIFINAYLLGTTVFARPGGNASARLARIAAEFMGTEAVHRALALQSLGRLGNDRAFMRFAHGEQAPNLPTTGSPGFYKITEAVSQLQAAGFGFGAEGSKAGRFYDFDEVRKRTPDDPDVNTRTPL